jgi:hypothetical protein
LDSLGYGWMGHFYPLWYLLGLSGNWFVNGGLVRKDTLIKGLGIAFCLLFAQLG